MAEPADHVPTRLGLSFGVVSAVAVMVPVVIASMRHLREAEARCGEFPEFKSTCLANAGQIPVWDVGMSIVPVAGVFFLMKAIGDGVSRQRSQTT